MEVKLTASVEELNALISLMDTAVKTLGLSVAAVAVHWDMKIKAAAQEADAAAKAAAEKAKEVVETPKLTIVHDTCEKDDDSPRDVGQDSPL
jgi:hypothetical protein